MSTTQRTYAIGGRTLITCHEAAKVHGCSMGYIRRLAREGRIFAEMLGRTYLVDADQVRGLSDGPKRLAQGFAAN